MTWGRQSTGSRGVRTAAVALAVGVLALSSCARFDDAASTPFTPEPTFDSGPGFGPQDPTTTTTTPNASAVPPGPCEDPDPAVVATCLDTTGGLVTLPGGGAALVTERRTGRILQVAPDTEPVEIATVPVDASGDGGLLDVALSPTFDEDRLLYAYITTPSDNRVVRIAAGDTPKDVLTGIPRGATGNGGAIEFISPTEMVVLTGNAGNSSAATDPASLAGKLLEFPLPAPGAAPVPTVVLSGIGTAGDVCRDPGGNLWVTDRTELEDRLQRIGADGSVGSGPAWTWPERPGVAGCAASPDGIAVALTGGKAVAVVAIDPGSGAVTAAPVLTVQDRYGLLRGAAASPDGLLWISTVNKSGGEPGPNDDRVVRIQFPAGGGGFD